ncbi:MAG TPA: 2-oxo acid dehydrogenase subunit E2 [Chloroflexaceae bacterium]|nr:2-oxo acid dehydrogenase subunit E2 [Chloroflexaceae bacterium]
MAEPSSAAVSGSPGLPIETLTFEVDVTRALAAVAAARAPAGRQALPVGLAALVAAAAAGLLPAYPELNGAWGGEVAVLRRRAHVALGEAGPGGLRWAVVADAGDLTARGVARAVAGGAGGEATFAVVSLAEGASWQSAAPPLAGTAAALSVGAPAPRLVCWGDGVAVRTVATLTLSYDARLVGQRRAACFLRALRERLEGLPTRDAPAWVL